jgi:hypothetical protein
LATIVGSCFAGAGLEACGGTNGREGLPQPNTSTAADAGVDGTLEAASPDGGDASEAFDTAIQYSEASLPDISPPRDAGNMQVNSLPLCAPDIPAVLNPDGSVTPFYEGGTATLGGAGSGTPTELPAIFTDDGGQVLAPDGSPCATQVWLGSAACDECVRVGTGGVPNDPWHGAFGTAVLPPCSDLAEAGTAAVGLGAGQTRYQLCINLYNCIMRTGCWATSPPGTLGACICSYPSAFSCFAEGGPGPCLDEEKAALEISGGTPPDQYLLLNKILFDTNPGVGHAGGATNWMFQFMNDNCLPPEVEAGTCPLGTDGGSGDGG